MPRYPASPHPTDSPQPTNHAVPPDPDCSGPYRSARSSASVLTLGSLTPSTTDLSRLERHSLHIGLAQVLSSPVPFIFRQDAIGVHLVQVTLPLSLASRSRPSRTVLGACPRFVSCDLPSQDPLVRGE